MQIKDIQLWLETERAKATQSREGAIRTLQEANRRITHIDSLTQWILEHEAERNHEQ